MDKPKKVIIFTNIPAPYRIALFNDLEEIRLSYKKYFDFEVFFMRITESNRQWKVDTAEFRFKYKIGKGFYYTLKGIFLHFNPVLIFHALRSKNEIILGASWNNLNVLFIIFLKRIGLIQNTLSIWTEANYLTKSNQKKNTFRDKLRLWIFRSIDGVFIIPGEMALISFSRWGFKPENIIILPNLVSERLFKTDRIKQYLNIEKPTFLIVARLDEQLKGILNFIKSIGKENIKKIIIKIVGEGPSKTEYIKYIVNNNISKNVYLLGNLTQTAVSKEYDNADIFVLPSFSDPSPLTVVEACKKGLPLLISERCGNHFEAVKSGQNGYTFNPFDPIDIKNKFNLILNQRDKWKSFSDQSKKLAKKNFDNKTVLIDFINQMVK